MKNVLYITYDGLTDPLGQSQVLPYLQQLVKQGYAFTILSFEKRSRFEKESKVVQAIVDAAGIRWVPLFFTSKPPILSKIYDRYRMWQTTLRLHKEKQFDLVHCRSYIAAEMGLRLKLQFGVKMLFDMRGFWADEKVDNGQWNLNKLLYKRIYSFYKNKERSFLLQADGIVSLTQAAKDFLHRRKEYKSLPITVIPCCADLEHFDFNAVPEGNIEKVRNQLNIPATAKVMTYLGSIGGWYMTFEMFRFFAALQKQHPEYIMLILTKDDDIKVIEEAVKVGVPAENLRVTYSTRKDLPSYLALSSCSIFFIRNTFSKTASSPTKHAELMGMGVPVICNAIGDTGNIIDTTHTGIVLNEFDESSIGMAISHIKELEQIDKWQIRKSAKEIFDLEAGVCKYGDLYDQILQGKQVATII